MAAETPVQTDLSIHFTKGEAAYAATCGTLVGLGVIFPPAAGVGLIGGAIGAIRVHGRETNERAKVSQGL